MSRIRRKEEFRWTPEALGVFVCLGFVFVVSLLISMEVAGRIVIWVAYGSEAYADGLRIEWATKPIILSNGEDLPGRVQFFHVALFLPSTLALVILFVKCVERMSEHGSHANRVARRQTKSRRVRDQDESES